MITMEVAVHVGIEHLLLGLLEEGESTAAQVLARLGADHARARERVLAVLTGECEQAGSRTEPAAELVDVAEQVTQVQRLKEAAFAAGDLDRAAALRDRERQLLADKLRLEQELTAGVRGQVLIAENQTALRARSPARPASRAWHRAGRRRGPARLSARQISLARSRRTATTSAAAPAATVTANVGR